MAGRRPERRLATVLFLDIVDSTRIASEVGDRRWRDLLGEFRRIVRRDVRAQHGHEQDTAGDGFFVTFARPANAVHAAARIVRDVQPLGLDVRCGVHAGELERIGRGLGGIGAHIGARVMAQAGPAEVLVTGTVHDLVVGSGISFAPMADTELKGVPGRWTLYRVADVDGVALPRPLGPRALNARLGDQRREAAVPPVAVALAAVTVIIAAAMGAYALVPRAPASLGSAPSPSGGYPITMLGIDPETNEIVDRVRDSHLSIGRPSPVFVVDGTLWQETPVALVRRNLNTGVVEETMKLPENTWAVFFASGSIWFGREQPSGEVFDRVDPVSKRVIASISIGRPTLRFPPAVGRDAIWFLRQRELLELRPASNEIVDMDVVRTQTIPDGFSAVGDVLWICECSEGRLVKYDPADDQIVATLDFAQRGFVLPDARLASQGALSIDEGTVWLLDADGATVTPVDASTGQPGQPMGIPPDVTGHAFGFGSLWMAGGGVVHRIDLESREITGIRMPEGVLGRGIALDEPTGVVWVSNCRPGFRTLATGCDP